MAGVGLGFDLDERLELHGEFVERDDTESIQANLLYRFFLPRGQSSGADPRVQTR